MMRTIKKRENGFTFIEIMLISVIVLLIAVSITMLFTGGRKTWTSADKNSETIQNAVVGMEKIVREIKNSPGLSYFNSSEIRFAVLRKDNGDLDGDGDTTEYIVKYAKTRRDGEYLKYGERETDSDNDGDWTLSDLAYPVTNLSFNFKKLDGTDAIPGTDNPADVKSVLINMTTSEDGVTIPLNSRAYLVMDTLSARNFDGTPDNPGESGPDKHHFNEGYSDEPCPPPAKGDGVKGWSLSDYLIYGDEEVIITGGCQVLGNVGTRSLAGKPYLSSNGTVIDGYLIVKRSLYMNNGSQTNNDSVLAACVSSSSDSSIFANAGVSNAHFWTLKNITMSNESWINGTVYTLPATNITLNHTAKYNERVDIKPDSHKFMLDPKEGGVDIGKSVFPILPPATAVTFSSANNNLTIHNQTNPPALDGEYGNVTVSGNTNLTIRPGSKIKNLLISNSARVNLLSGNYCFDYIRMTNSSRIRFNFTPGEIKNRVIRIFVKTSVLLQNSGSFEYLDNGEANADPNFGADMLYIEPNTGMTLENSVQWRGLIYAPNGNISFANGTRLAGAAYSGKKAILGNLINAIYVPPAYDYLNRKPILLGVLFYPQNP